MRLSKLDIPRQKRHWRRRGSRAAIAGKPTATLIDTNLPGVTKGGSFQYSKLFLTITSQPPNLYPELMTHD